MLSILGVLNLKNDPDFLFKLKLFDYYHPKDDAHNAFAILASNVTGLINAAAYAIFVLMFVIGGIFYITSNGNPQRTESAKKYLTYAVGGLLLVILADFLTSLAVSVTRNFGLRSSISEGVQYVTDYLVAITGGLAVLFIIIGGLKYMTSRGNTDQVNSAKKTITYAVAGLIAVILAWTIASFIVHVTDYIFA